MANARQNAEVAEKWGTRPYIRWLDTSELGMRLYLALYKTGRRLVMENGDLMPRALKRLKFKPGPGGFWYRDETTFNPKEFMEALPGSHVNKETPISDAILDLTEREAGLKGGAETALDQITALLIETQPVFLGLNHQGAEVYENKDGTRVTLSKEGSATERDLEAPSLFLRAHSERALRNCALGYVRTLAALERHEPEYVQPATFMRAIGLDPAVERDRFATAVSEAAVLAVCGMRDADRLEATKIEALVNAMDGLGIAVPLDLVSLSEAAAGFNAPMIRR